MKINLDIFRAYDVRGTYPQDINEEIASKIGQAFVYFLKAKSGKEELNIIVGRDNRISSPDLHKALIWGIVNSGVNVIDIGLSTSPMLYFAVSYYQSDGGIEITASHNPPGYNGFKLVGGKGIPLSEKTGIQDIKELVLKNEFKQEQGGKMLEQEVLEDYVSFLTKDFTGGKPLEIVIDTANGIAGIVIPKIFEKLSQKVYHLFPELDGNFPNHPPNPSVRDNLKVLQQEVKDRKADLGIAFDGDGDRIVFIAEDGEVISADLICALIIDLILRNNPKGKILYDLRSSNIVRETIEKAGGIPLMGRVGHSFIKERMRKEDIVFAEELSGHYYFKDHYFSESPFFVLFKVIEKMSESGKKISSLVEDYKKYFHSGEINFEVKDKDKKIKELEDYFINGEISHLDGIRVDFPDWWFNVRPSNTEPFLRLVVEAKTRKLMEEKKKEIVKLIKK